MISLRGRDIKIDLQHNEGGAPYEILEGNTSVAFQEVSFINTMRRRVHCRTNIWIMNAIGRKRTSPINNPFEGQRMVLRGVMWGLLNKKNGNTPTINDNEKLKHSFQGRGESFVYKLK
ncbi:hypothetical protein CDAR_454801 [Caerostris darwini]|uniref:Uncharacterized protein n=1 Tax=Caerostris darwini TaxID=1538125 RepID=A0AAV4TZR2_9ARAC|nr:hypothetical protein CDAR_454801 [Caerostris darwini]